jgi:hypothetical protein
MAQSVRIVGVHPIDADEPVHLIEIEVARAAEPFDFGEVTQELTNQPQSNWQVAYDERELESKSGTTRYVFFFHHLDPTKPIITAVGPLPLPPTSPLPHYLREIEYESP